MQLSLIVEELVGHYFRYNPRASNLGKGLNKISRQSLLFFKLGSPWS
jgi:hypothetical protein